MADVAVMQGDKYKKLSGLSSDKLSMTVFLITKGTQAISIAKQLLIL